VNSTLSRHLLFVAIVVVTAACVLMISITVVARVLRTRSTRHDADARDAVHHAVLVVAAGEDDGSAASWLGSLARRDRDAAGAMIVGLLPKLQGEPAEVLVEIVRGYGSLDRAAGDLTSRSAVTRARAAWTLGLTRDHNDVEKVRPLLSDRSSEVRLAAVETLGRLRDVDAAGPILDTLSPSGGRAGVPAVTVAEALMRLGGGIVDELRVALADDDPARRDVAARVAGHQQLIALTPHLRQLLADDPSDVVRVSAAEALGRIGGIDDAAALAATCAETEPSPLRRAAAAALGELGHPAALPTLAALLGDRDRRLAEISASSLLEFGVEGRNVLDGVAADAEHGRAAAFALELDRLRGEPRGAR